MPKRPRKDNSTERDVRTVIRIADLGFPRNAAEIAKNLGIPLDVSLRVILRPSKRRSTKKES